MAKIVKKTHLSLLEGPLEYLPSRCWNLISMSEVLL